MRRRTRQRRRRAATCAVAVLVGLTAGWLVAESRPVPTVDELATTATGPAGDDGPARRRLPLAEPGVEASVQRLLQAVTGRAPSGAELDAWVPRYRDGEPLASLAQALAATPDYARNYGDTTDAVYVDRLYRHVLGRPATVSESAYWTSELAGGRSRSDVLVAFSDSDDFVRRTGTPPPQAPRPRLAPPGVEHSVARLYLGLAGRWPRRDELDAGVDRYLGGTALATIAGAVLDTPELAGRYDHLTDDGFVDRIWEDVLGRPPAAADTQVLKDRLRAGDSRASVVVTLTESAEMVTRTRTANPAPAPVRKVLFAVGDSVMLGAVAAIEAIEGWAVAVDARSCRRPTRRGDGCQAADIPSGIDALRSARANGYFGGAVVIQLGNNGPMSDDEFEAVMSEVADQRLVLVLNLKEPRPFEASNNAVIAGAVKRHPNARLLDWNALGNRHDEYFADTERIHLSFEGAQAMAGMIAAALPS